MSNRFRGYLPVVIDVETAGFNSQTDALLEIAAVTLTMDDDGNMLIDESYEYNVEPFEGANLEQAALDFTGIDPFNPLRGAIAEAEAMEKIFKPIRKAVKSHNCKRAILVGHNASFDHGFVTAAAERCDIKRNPFHPFSTFDTATLAGLAFGHTVLAKSCELADIDFDGKQAHSALYDTMKTAELFCTIVNRWKDLGGWQMAESRFE
ncbi:ribonuclease T [Amphritea sp. 2_MG-2023]|jgi:ribonuclease T|uniref:ribonuclease T n=1 Tax=Amphritea TaxID=515417 RepID=UPI001C074B1B|nr:MULTISPECIES: ribonuclease T [Amphritea]MBU2967429.1 ribonuclease T [Amphritea atlantica]MDO6418316.1 ribonuclease T [Amphritea sp. 2_MG-2023]MDX2422298.1 ribonuclease T [Amphritea sp.]